MKVALTSPRASFALAFASARAAGADAFDWRGNRYTTQLAEEKVTDLSWVILEIMEVANDG